MVRKGSTSPRKNNPKSPKKNPGRSPTRNMKSPKGRSKDKVETCHKCTMPTSSSFKLGMCDECFMHHMVLKIIAWKLYEYQCAYINAARGRSLLKVLNRGDSAKTKVPPQSLTKKQLKGSSSHPPAPASNSGRAGKQKIPNMSPKSTKKTNDKNTSRSGGSPLKLPLSSAPPQQTSPFFPLQKEESPFARSPPAQCPFPGFPPPYQPPSAPHNRDDEFPPSMHENTDEFMDTSGSMNSPSSLFHALTTLGIDDTHELPKWLHLQVTKDNFLDYVYVTHPHLFEAPHEQNLVPYPDPFPLKVSASNPVKEEDQENFEVNFPLKIGFCNKMFVIGGDAFFSSAAHAQPSAPPPSPKSNHKVTKITTIEEEEETTSMAVEEGGSSSSPSPRRSGMMTGARKKCDGTASRCHTCGKKLGISTTFDCRCGFIFCRKHSYSEDHACEFDYHELQKQRVREDNPVIRGEKIRKI